MNDHMQAYTNSIAKNAINTVVHFYLGLAFGGALGAACMFIVMQQR